MINLFELINGLPVYMQAFVFVCIVIGAMVLWRLRKYVIIVAMGAIGIYLSIKKTIAGDE